jgi:CheY-like chemotaxis protein
MFNNPQGMGGGRAVKKVYIADDDPIIITLMECGLHSLKEVQATFFDNGLDLYRQIQKDPPDAIVTDILLPKLEGLSVTRLVKFNGSYRHIPILVVSSIFDPDIAEQVRRAGADDFLRKPFTVHDLRAKVSGLLQRT